MTFLSPTPIYGVLSVQLETPEQIAEAMAWLTPETEYHDFKPAPSARKKAA